jgi:hypothetical protein
VRVELDGKRRDADAAQKARGRRTPASRKGWSMSCSLLLT